MGWVNGWMDRWMDGCMYGYMGGWMVGWMDGCMDCGHMGKNSSPSHLSSENHIMADEGPWFPGVGQVSLLDDSDHMGDSGLQFLVEEEPRWRKWLHRSVCVCVCECVCLEQRACLNHWIDHGLVKNRGRAGTKTRPGRNRRSRRRRGSVCVLPRLCVPGRG